MFNIFISISVIYLLIFQIFKANYFVYMPSFSQKVKRVFICRVLHFLWMNNVMQEQSVLKNKNA